MYDHPRPLLPRRSLLRVHTASRKARGPSVTDLPRRCTRRSSCVRGVQFDWLLRLLDMCLNVYPLVSFLATSSLVDNLLMRQASFMDDIVHGVYNLTPLLPVDVKIQSILQQGHAGQSKRIGVRDASLAFPGGNHSLSWCMRVNISLGVQYHTMYNHDGVSRRLLRFVHTNLPPSCVGWTVAPGGSHDAPRLHVVDDARSGYGTSYLHCTDQRYYIPPLGQATNVSQFRFRAGYIVAQQRDAGGDLSVETHISQCKAEKIGDSLVYKVSPAIEGDDTEDVNILFGQKSRLLTLLDYAGQMIVLSVLLFEATRASVPSVTRVPTQSFAWYATAIPWLSRDHVSFIEFMDVGHSVMSLSQLWLANPWYLMGNCMYAIGTTHETQTLVEIFFWQFLIRRHVTDLIYAVLYSVRQAWVSVFFWTTCRAAIRRLKVPRWLRTNVCAMEAYVSCRSTIVAFMLACLGTGFLRGSLILTQRLNVVDMGSGMAEAPVWSSQDMTTLLICHGFAIALGGSFGVCICQLLRWRCPGHERNSFVRAVQQHRVVAGFDIAHLLGGSRSLNMGGRCVLLLPLADLYHVYASVNVLQSTCMRPLPRNLPRGNAIECATDAAGVTLRWSDSGLHVPALAELQVDATGYIYCAVV
ncbi:hypothetical protein SDRG_16493 [Saprolegnia diclina VS20]|uniref:Uncharacterized protein n=1 Tax=Saprolegnia diclina (strain VS20) TaxID=1156394 RepID=T0R0X4_SAPDV|nr:hypothetical protein SDRG_16493 [Saprolegnia diclina VS20]EQC25638.1 hypothetical protein SDRG_16493 [Saprolegnia diclina VS20]|eukprot:XP_008620929.1 hypothetical protein SDRG_16493 [Saprolegnia diclina VS20]